MGENFLMMLLEALIAFFCDRRYDRHSQGEKPQIVHKNIAILDKAASALPILAGHWCVACYLKEGPD